MAANTLKVGITAETNGFVQGTKQAQDAVAKLGNESKKTAKQIKTISGAANSEKRIINELAYQYHKLTDEEKKAFGADIKRDIDSHIEKLKEYKSVQADINDKVSGSTSAFSNFGNVMGQVGTKIGLPVSSLTSLVNPTTAAIAGVAALGAAFVHTAKETEQFNVELNNLSTRLNVPKDQLKSFGDEAIELGNKFGKSGQDIVKQFNFIAQQLPGIEKDRKGLSDLTDAINLLSVGMGTDLETATNAAVTVMSKFGLAASDSTKVVNTLAEVSRNSGASLEYQSQVFEKVGAAANAINVPFNDIAAATGVLSSSFADASQVGAGLLAMINKLGKQKDEFNPAVVGLQKAVENLKAANLSYSDIASMVGPKAAQVASVLIQQQDAFDKLAEKTNNTAAAEEMFGVKSEELGFIINKVKTMWENFLLKIGESKVFQTIMGIIKDVITWVEDLSTEIQNFFANTEIGSGFADMWNLIREALKSLLPVIGAVIKVFVVMQSTISKAISFIIQAIIEWDTMMIGVFKGMYDTIVSVWNSIKDFIVNVWHALIDPIVEFVDNVKQYMSNLWDNIKSVFQAIHDLIVIAFNTVLRPILDVVDSIKSYFNDLWDNIKSIFSSIYDSIVSAFVSVLMPIMNVVNKITGFFNTLWENIKSIFDSIYKKIADTAAFKAIVKVYQWFKDKVTQLIKIVQDAWNGFLDALGIGGGKSFKVQKESGSDSPSTYKPEKTVNPVTHDAGGSKTNKGKGGKSGSSGSKSSNEPDKNTVEWYNKEIQKRQKMLKEEKHTDDEIKRINSEIVELEKQRDAEQARINAANQTELKTIEDYDKKISELNDELKKSNLSQDEQESTLRKIVALETVRNKLKKDQDNKKAVYELEAKVTPDTFNAVKEKFGDRLPMYIDLFKDAKTDKEVKDIADKYENVLGQIKLKPQLPENTELHVPTIEENKRNLYDTKIKELGDLQKDYDIGLIDEDRFIREFEAIKEKLESEGMIVEVKPELRRTKEFENNLNSITDAVGSIGSAISSIGDMSDDPGAKVAGIIAQAIANIALGAGKAMATSGELGPGWIAVGAAIIAQMAAMIAQVHSVTGYASGGIVGGTTTTGDQVLARLNRGEMVLNNRQQANLFNALDNGIDDNSSGAVVSTVRVRGEDIIMSLKNYSKVHGKSSLTNILK